MTGGPTARFRSPKGAHVPTRRQTTRLSIEELYQLRAADLATSQSLTARMRTARMKTVLRDIRPIVATADLVASSSGMLKSATFAHRCRRGRPPNHPNSVVPASERGT